MQQIAMSWLVFRLTGSVLLLATVTFMAQIPILVATPYMSGFVDWFDRRKLLVLTQSLSMVQALLMALPDNRQALQQSNRKVGGETT